MFRETKELYEFGSFRLDVSEHTLTLSDGSKSYTLPEKAFQTLCVLIQKRGHLLTKQELLAEIWPDSFVEENNLDKCIHAIRQVLGEKPGEQKYIETVRKHGYRFVAEVNHLGGPNDGAASVLDSEFLTESIPNTNVIDRSPAPTSERTRGIGRTTIVVAIVFLGAAMASIYFLYPAKEVVAKDRTEFAVLPVNPIDPANRSDLYEIGIADSLIQGLSSINGFVVRPLTATRKYTDIGQDPLAAGREQKVDYVLVSSYQISDGRIKFTSQLLNVADGKIEETYKSESELSGVFAAQEAVASLIRSKLMARFERTFVRPAAKPGTANQEAYRFYLQGLILVDQRAAQKAIENFEQAVTLDPNYALAWAGLAHAHSANSWEVDPVEINEEYQKTREAFTKALELDPYLSEGYSAMCFYGGDFVGQEPACRRAVELDPNSPMAHKTNSIFLLFHGRFDEGIAEIKTAIDLDPKSYFNQRIYAQGLYFARRYDEAVAQFKRLIERNEADRVAYTWLVNTLEAQGNESEAFEWYLRSQTLQKQDNKTIQRFKTAYQRSGWQGVLLERSNDTDNYFRCAGVYARLGNKDKAFEYLEKVYQQHSPYIGWLQVEPQLDPLRDDPRYVDLVKRVESKGNGSF